MVKIRSVAWSDHFTCSAKICVNQGICVYVQILTYWIEGRWRICPELGLDLHNAFLGNLTTGFLTVSPQYVWFSALQTSRLNHVSLAMSKGRYLYTSDPLGPLTRFLQSD